MLRLRRASSSFLWWESPGVTEKKAIVIFIINNNYTSRVGFGNEIPQSQKKWTKRVLSTASWSTWESSGHLLLTFYTNHGKKVHFILHLGGRKKSRKTPSCWIFSILPALASQDDISCVFLEYPLLRGCIALRIDNILEITVSKHWCGDVSKLAALYMIAFCSRHKVSFRTQSWDMPVLISNNIKFLALPTRSLGGFHSCRDTPNRSCDATPQICRLSNSEKPSPFALGFSTFTAETWSSIPKEKHKQKKKRNCCWRVPEAR